MCPSQLVSQTLNKNNKRHTPPPAQSHQQQGHYKTKDNNPPTNQEKTPTSRTGCRQMLASTIHISNTPPTNPTHQHTANRQRRRHRTNKPHPQEKPPGAFAGLIPQGPTACQNQPPTHRTPRFHTHHHHPPRGAAAAGSTEEARRARRRRSSMIPLVNTTNASHTDGGCAGRVLLRKEVIQPHLPVRLPCYDFVPIASPTFDGSPHKGWATGFGCCRLS